MLQSTRSSGPVPAGSLGLSRNPTAYWSPSERTGSRRLEPHTRQSARSVTAEFFSVMFFCCQLFRRGRGRVPQGFRLRLVRVNFSGAKEAREQVAVGTGLK